MKNLILILFIIIGLIGNSQTIGSLGGVAIANIGSIGGVDIANVGSIGGVDLPSGSTFANEYYVSFGGDTEYATLTEIDFGTDDFSLNFWFRTATVAAATKFFSGSLFLNGYVQLSTSTTIRVRVVGANLDFTLNTHTIAVDTWYMVTVVRDYPDVEVYVNGEVQTDTESYSGGFRIQRVARLGSVSNAVDLDEWSLYDGTLLSQADIDELYDQDGVGDGTPEDCGNPADITGLTTYWPMGDEDTHPTLTDNEGSSDITMINMASGDIVAH